MNKAEGLQKGDPRSVSPGRHKRNCTVCGHDKCEEIEREFVNWTAASAIARDYGLADKASVYRHAHAFGLFVKRQRNIRAALEKIIERAFAKLTGGGEVVTEGSQHALPVPTERMRISVIK